MFKFTASAFMAAFLGALLALAIYAVVNIFLLKQKVTPTGEVKTKFVGGDDDDDDDE